MTIGCSSGQEGAALEVDRVLLDALYRGRLVELRERAEDAGLSKRDQSKCCVLD